ncbi:DUF4139 domain-containing protein [Roseovarius sp. SCSIO 43702]|uniref:DUF4139 domain-containing protein n=1 Tax=Roseovarius sp. SCSIO 43702 TaxID=2823043 RepID=UPI001C72B8B1|nr:DUF4139 domain-containing protein [Roseovarius sp. SCSIO 43702]QYX56249.1 DUF4139 domain-containing protein [Roseovarius sp. SCSIO 43702]
MRALPLILAVFPSVIWAADIPVETDVSTVTLYPRGGTVIREASFDVTEGSHDLIVLDLPRNTDLGSVRVAVEGATLGAVTARQDYVPPRDDTKSAAIEAAEAEVERLEEDLRDALAEIRRIELAEEAAAARIAFLGYLGSGEGVAGMDVTTLRDLSRMIGEETLAAKVAAHEARLRAEEAERNLEDTREALQKARDALAALVPQDTPRALLAVAVEAEAAGEGRLTLTYNVAEASWGPVYDMRLERESGALTIERGAYVAQATGENWEGVALSLSTVRPSDQTDPSEIHPWRRWIEDEAQVKRQTHGAVTDLQMEPAYSESRAEGDMAEAPAPVIVADADYDGLAVTYSYPEPVTLASGADRVRVTLGELTTETEVYARAVPLADRTAFLVAGMTNETGELILPGEVMKYLDGRYVGRGFTDLVPVGAETDIAFGPIEGLRLKRQVEDREEGDRGVISRSNDLSERVRIEVENLTARAWPVRLTDRVPYTEQEDLEIDWEATPMPDTRDVDGERGILEWRFDIAPGETQVITLEQELEWPEGKVLR